MNCRSCAGTNLTPVLDLGDQYLSDFRADNERPPKHPLKVVYCTDCFLAQLTFTTPRAEMYHERYGFKSGVNDTIRADLESIVNEALTVLPDADTWLDVGCNDGTLLSYVPTGIWRNGIEPVKKLAEEARQYADRVVRDFFEAHHFHYRFEHGTEDQHPKFDVVTSISMFYDLDDPNQFVHDIKEILAPDGVWVVQQNYLGATVRLNAIDNVCHEHLTYFSLLSLRKLLSRHGLEVFRVSQSGVNGGSFRTLIQHKGTRPVEASVGRLLTEEVNDGLQHASTIQAFAVRSLRRVQELADLVADINSRGERVYIYGASTRGGTLWQAAGLDVSDLPFAVDRNPEKVGKTIASIGVPIISEDQARSDNPEFMLVSPWFFRDEFLQRESAYLEGGGKFILPLPVVQVVGAKEVRLAA